MPRIDESPKDSFQNIEDVIANQIEAIELLDKFYLLQSSRVSDIQEKLRVFQSSVKAEPEIYSIVNTAFDKSPKFQAWLKKLTPEDQEKTTIRVQQDLNTKMYKITLGTNDSIQLGNELDGYETTDYIARVQSRWLKNQLAETSNETNINTAKQIEAFIRDERVCVCKTAILRILLTQYLNDSRLRAKDRESITTCLTLLDKHKEAYEALHLHEILKPANQTLDDVVEGFCKKYQSKAYVKYYKTLENLVSHINAISTLGDKYPGLASNDELVQAAATIMKRPADSVHVLEQSQAFSPVLPTASNRLASFDGIKDVDAVLHLKTIPAQRQEAALGAILSSESIAMPYTNKTDQAIHYRSAYLENMLLEAFPAIFQKDNDMVVVVHPSLASEIYEALGSEMINPIIDPQKFNVSLLNQLRENDSNNPLWNMLIMIKPVNKSFTITNKINACIEVIKHISAGELKLDNTTPLEQTRILAPYLLELIQTPANKTTFTIEKQIEAHLNVIKLIQKGQLKIDNKPTIKQAEDVAKSALKAYDLSGKYNTTLTQLFSDIKEATDLSMATRGYKKIAKALTGAAPVEPENQSVQKQLKELLKGKRPIIHHESDTDSVDSTDENDNTKTPGSKAHR